jgi:hypothetical protein
MQQEFLLSLNKGFSEYEVQGKVHVPIKRLLGKNSKWVFQAAGESNIILITSVKQREMCAAKPCTPFFLSLQCTLGIRGT